MINKLLPSVTAAVTSAQPIYALPPNYQKMTGHSFLSWGIWQFVTPFCKFRDVFKSDHHAGGCPFKSRVSGWIDLPFLKPRRLFLGPLARFRFGRGTLYGLSFSGTGLCVVLLPSGGTRWGGDRVFYDGWEGNRHLSRRTFFQSPPLGELKNIFFFNDKFTFLSHIFSLSSIESWKKWRLFSRKSSSETEVLTWWRLARTFQYTPSQIWEKITFSKISHVDFTHKHT